jgi:hypothetical protein
MVSCKIHNSAQYTGTKVLNDTNNLKLESSSIYQQYKTKQRNYRHTNTLNWLLFTTDQNQCSGEGTPSWPGRDRSSKEVANAPQIHIYRIFACDAAHDPLSQLEPNLLSVWLIQWLRWKNMLILYYNEANFYTYAISYTGKIHSLLATINKYDP